MFKRAMLAAIIAASAVIPRASQARDSDLAPSSTWLMDYADDSCQLTRSFGTGDDQVIAQFIRYKPGASFDFHLFGKPLGNQGHLPVAMVRFGAVGKFVRAETMAGFAVKLPALFLAGRLDNLDSSRLNHNDFAEMEPAQLNARDRIAPEVEAAATSVTVRLSRRTVTLRLGAMDAPMAAMRTCTTDLVKLWGLDPAQQEALTAFPRPKNNPGRWLGGGDYPAGSLFRGEQAMIRYRLMIDAMGQPIGCSIQAALAKGNFAEITCDMLKRRAQFEPARAADGTATPSYYVGKVRWIIP